MVQILHGSARTTETVRHAIQTSQASIRSLAQQYGINPKTVAKWRKRADVQDARMGPKEVHSTVLSTEEEALIVAFRKHTLLPLDDCLYVLQETIPHLTRSALHRCLQRHGISRLSEVTDKPSKKTRFKLYPIGYFHLDIAEVQTEEGKLYLFVAIDRTSKFAFAELHERMTRPVAVEFLRHLIAAVPYKIHTILTDNGIQFANRPTDRYAFTLLFDRICVKHEIEHRLTKPNHPWTNGQVERMNRTLKEATVYRYYYDTHQQLREHLATFLMAYNFAKRLKTLKGLTPYEYICLQWQKQPERFLSDPSHLTLGLHILHFLDQVAEHWLEGDLILILDNLSVHRAFDIRLWALAHSRVCFLFQPTYAPWLNLIEPWWKTLRSLALNGRRFETVDQMASAIRQATSYWLDHRHPFIWRKAA